MYKQFRMPHLTVETRKCVIVLKKARFSVKEILKSLEEEEVYQVAMEVPKVWLCGRLEKPRPPKKLLKEQYVFIDNTMAEKDELTACQLRDLVEDWWLETKASLSTYKRVRKDLGWIETRPKYCQLIREANHSSILLGVKRK